MDRHMVVVTEPTCWDGKYRYHKITQSTYPWTGWIITVHELDPALGTFGHTWGGGKVLNLMTPVDTEETAHRIALRFWMSHLGADIHRTNLAKELDGVIAGA